MARLLGVGRARRGQRRCAAAPWQEGHGCAG
jgi:hypothetical protein